MPRYDYQCILHKCNFEFEVTHKITEDPLIKCPKCESSQEVYVPLGTGFFWPDAE